MIKSKKSNEPTFHLVVVGVDACFYHISGAGQIAWSRPESLASIVSVEMLDLPLSETEQSIETEFTESQSIKFILFSNILFFTFKFCFGFDFQISKSINFFNLNQKLQSKNVFLRHKLKFLMKFFTLCKILCKISLSINITN